MSSSTYRDHGRSRRAVPEFPHASPPCDRLLVRRLSGSSRSPSVSLAAGPRYRELRVRGITGRRSGHGTETSVYSLVAEPARGPRGLEQDDAGVGDRGQRAIAALARVEPTAAGDDRRSQPGVRLVPERLRSGARHLFRVDREPAQPERGDNCRLPVVYHATCVSAGATVGQYLRAVAPGHGSRAGTTLCGATSRDDQDHRNQCEASARDALRITDRVHPSAGHVCTTSTLYTLSQDNAIETARTAILNGVSIIKNGAFGIQKVSHY